LYLINQGKTLFAALYIGALVHQFRCTSLDDLRSSFSRYATGDLLEINQAAFEEFFTSCVDTQISWTGLLDESEGTNHIPLMTIHKSKGLEFDTTIFMGIDDNAW